MATKIEEFFKSLETEDKDTKQEQTADSNQQVVSQETQESSVSEHQSQTEQSVQSEQLIGGKFRSVDDLMNSYSELERKFYNIQEQLKRAEQMIEAFNKTQPSVQYNMSSVSNVNNVNNDFDIDVDPLVDPKNFAKKMYEKITANVINQVQQQILLQQQMAEVRKRFYDLNPDLVGKEKLVGVIAQDVAREMPNAPLEFVLEEVAKRTRQFLKSLTGQQKVVTQPVNQTPTPQVSVSREKVPQVSEKELTPEELAQEYIKQRKEFLTKKKF